MARFQYRLAKVFEWYEKRCRLEESRLGTFAASAAQAESALELHKKQVLAHQTELIQSPNVQAYELAALGSFCRQAKRRELLLRENWQTRQRSLDSQRQVVLAAQRRFRLVEKLRDRRLEEHRYQEAKELEELASESYLAGFARSLNEEKTI